MHAEVFRETSLRPLLFHDVTCHAVPLDVDELRAAHVAQSVDGKRAPRVEPAPARWCVDGWSLSSRQRTRSTLRRIRDRHGRKLLSVRDQNTFDKALRKKRLMTLTHLFLIHRYKISAVHYVSPTEDNRYQTQKMKTHGLFSDVHEEVGHIIVADVDAGRIQDLLAEDRKELEDLIHKRYP